MSKSDVIIVGAGLSGLSCARRLQKEGLNFLLLDAADAVGGRVRTDDVEGFQLDRGFQVFLTAYPECMDQLDYESLRLCGFIAGSLVRYRGRFEKVTDPWREPGGLLANLFSPVGSLMDKYRVSRLRGELTRMTLEEIFSSPETSTLQALQRRRFSQKMIDMFFTPLFGGVLLDQKLAASSRMFEFVFKMMAEGDVALPERGMRAIPEQLAEKLPAGSVRLGARVKSVEARRVVLDTGEELECESVVVATEGPEAARLVGSLRSVPSRMVTCMYFAAKEPPIEEPILVLDGNGRGPVTNLCVPNLIAPNYAPKGEYLVSMTVLGAPSRDESTLMEMTRKQMKRWFGLVAQEWRHLRTYRLTHALPAVTPLEWHRPARLGQGVFVCGDHRGTPSINGAMESGRIAAETLLREWGKEPAGAHAHYPVYSEHTGEPGDEPGDAGPA
jgi:phytoene dehydrogenase-like protein